MSNVKDVLYAKSRDIFTVDESRSVGHEGPDAREFP